MSWFPWRRRRLEASPPPDPLPEPRKSRRIRQSVLDAAKAVPGRAPVNPFVLPEPMPGVLPGGKSAMALDEAISSSLGWGGNNLAWAVSDAAMEGQTFLGYSYLASLAQRPEYRRGAEIIAREMTRKWIKLRSTGSKEDDKSEKLKAIGEAMRRLKLQDCFRRAAEIDGFFGRAQLFIDIDGANADLPLVVGPRTIKKGSLRGFRVVEPVWTYPAGYDSLNPLSPNFYRPSSWYVMGKEVHGSRLLTFVGREVPDLLKPSYAFGGLSLTQMAKPYVDNWLRTRQSVSDLLASFSVSGVKTDMSSLLMGEDAEDQVTARAELFNVYRDTRGLMLLQKGGADDPGEEFFNISTPLGTLDALQAQSQEQMASVYGVPLVKLLGITPSGLNASSDGEIRVFYDLIHSEQEERFADHLKVALDVIQLSEFGEIDPEITFGFEPLWQASEQEKATIRKTNADTAAVYINAGILHPEEERERLANEEDSLYPSLDVEDVPEVQEPPIDPDLEEEGETRDAA